MVPPISARITILALLQLAKASVSGAFELLPSSFIFWNTGDSLRRSRIQTEMPSRKTETRNGIRQPQFWNAVENTLPARAGSVAAGYGAAMATQAVPAQAVPGKLLLTKAVTNRITSSDRNRPSVAVV